MDLCEYQHLYSGSMLYWGRCQNPNLYGHAISVTKKLPRTSNRASLFFFSSFQLYWGIYIHLPFVYLLHIMCSVQLWKENSGPSVPEGWTIHDVVINKYPGVSHCGHNVSAFKWCHMRRINNKKQTPGKTYDVLNKKCEWTWISHYKS